jgi:hypothetical protein
VKLARVGDVVGRIGDDVSDGARMARLISTYTGKPTTRATANVTSSRASVRQR